MNSDDFRMYKNLYFPYTEEELERLRGKLPTETKPIARCTNLVFEQPYNVEIKTKG